MIGAVWKFIIFTSMMNRIVNTGSNERVIVQDMCPQIFDVCILGHMAHIEAIVQYLPHSDQHAAVLHFSPLQRHPVVWNCWTCVQCYWEMGDHCWIVARMPIEQKWLIHASQNAFCSGVAIITVLHHKPREKRGVGMHMCTKLNTCCPFRVGNLLLCVFSKV
jgi:hypothetical protein